MDDAAMQRQQKQMEEKPKLSHDQSNNLAYLS